MAPIDKVNSPRTLLEAEIVSINGRTVEPAPAKVELRLSPVPRVVVTFSELRLPDDRAFLSEEFCITFSTGVEIPVQLGFIEGASGVCSGSFLMSKDPVEVRPTGDSLRRVQFAVVNFCSLFDGLPTNPAATVTLDIPPWQISLSQVENFKELIKTLSQQGDTQSLITVKLLSRTIPPSHKKKSRWSWNSCSSIYPLFAAPFAVSLSHRDSTSAAN